MLFIWIRFLAVALQFAGRSVRVAKDARVAAARDPIEPARLIAFRLPDPRSGGIFAMPAALDVDRCAHRLTYSRRLPSRGCVSGGLFNNRRAREMAVYGRPRITLPRSIWEERTVTLCKRLHRTIWPRAPSEPDEECKWVDLLIAHSHPLESLTQARRSSPQLAL